jgi:hypothetical protein
MLDIQWFSSALFGVTGTNFWLGLTNTIAIITAATTGLPANYAAGLADSCRDRVIQIGICRAKMKGIKCT